MTHRWDLAAVASVAAWATSVLLVSESGAKGTPDSAAVRHLCLTAAGVATAVLYIERSRSQTIAAIRQEIREEVRAERQHNHLTLIQVGRKMGAAEAGGNPPAA